MEIELIIKKLFIIYKFSPHNMEQLKFLLVIKYKILVINPTLISIANNIDNIKS